MLTQALLSALEQCDVIVSHLQSLPSHQADRLYQDAGIGCHIRHVLDHFAALQAGSMRGCIDYDKRNRGSLVETNLPEAKTALCNFRAWLIATELPDVPVQVMCEVGFESTQTTATQSSLHREMLYVINHTVHHAAYIKLLMLGDDVVLPAHIGVAPVTASYRRQVGLTGFN